jgi:trimeric autotransporter adhesin
MPDNEVVFRLTSVYDGEQLAEGLSGSTAVIENDTAAWKEAFDSTESGMAADIAQMTGAIRVMQESLREAYVEYGDAAATGNEKAIQALAQQEQALIETKAALSALRQEAREYAAEQAAGGGGLAAVKATGAEPSETEAASASGFESLAATGTFAAGAGASVAGYEEMIAAQQGAAAAGTELNDVQATTIAADEVVTASLTEETAAYLRLTGVESAAAGAMERSTALGRTYASVKAAIASALGLETSAASAAVNAEVAAADASSAAATKSASAWADYAGLTDEVTVAVAAEGEAETVRAAATSGGIGATRAATAELRILEGGLAGSTRGAAAFLTTTLGLGPVLQAAFPVFGLIAFSAILYEIIEGAEKLYDNYVLLKDGIEEMGKASEKTAEEAAQAHQKAAAAIEEEMRARGDYQGAFQYEKSETEHRVEKISFEIDDKKLKDIQRELGPLGEQFAALRDQARSVNEVGPESDKFYADLHTGIANVTAALVGYQKAAKDDKAATEEMAAAAATSPEEGASTLVAGAEIEQERAERRVQLTTETLQTMQNVENKHASDSIAVASTTAAKGIQISQKQFSDMDEISRAHAENTKRIVEAEANYEEELAKHQVATGQITAAQEVSIVQVAAQQKLQAEIAYLSARNASLAKDPNLSKDTSRQSQIIENEGQIAAIREEMRTKDLAAEDAEAKAKLKVQVDAINEQIEAVKAVPAATIAAQEEADAQVLALQKEKLAAFMATQATQPPGLIEQIQSGQAIPTEEPPVRPPLAAPEIPPPDAEGYKTYLREIDQAEHASAETIKRESAEATEARLANLRRVIDLEDQKTAKDAQEAIKSAQFEAKQAQDALTLQEASRIQPKGGAIGAAYDLTQIQTQASQRLEIINQELAQESAADQTAANEKVTNLNKELFEVQAAKKAETITQEKYDTDVSRIQSDITKAVQLNEQQQVDLTRKATEETEQIEQQSALKQIQLQEQISSTMSRELDTMLFHSKSFSDAIQKLWQDAVRGIISEFVKMATEYVARLAVMVLAKKAADAALDAAVGSADIGSTIAGGASSTLAGASAGAPGGGIAGLVSKVLGAGAPGGSAALTSAGTTLTTAGTTLTTATTEFASSVPIFATDLTTFSADLATFTTDLTTLTADLPILTAAGTALSASAAALTSAAATLAASGAEEGAGGGAEDLFGDLFSFVGLAGGGPLEAGGSYIVGESGPEAIFVGSSGRGVVVPSAAEGWDLPSGGGPFPTLLHPEEMVLPSDIAGGVRNMTKNSMTNNDNSSEKNDAPAIGNFHYHAGDVHALDGSGVSDVLGKHPAQMAKLVTGLIRRGQIPRNALARSLR